LERIFGISGDIRSVACLDPLGVADVRHRDLLLVGEAVQFVRLAAAGCRSRESRETDSRRNAMTIERGLRGIAGTFVLASAVLAVVQSHYWLLLTGFVGLNLLQSAFTNWCPMVWLLGRLGFRACACK
jgi:hypothetical protein